MAPEIIVPSEAPIIKDITDKKSKIQQARASFEKQWLINIAFLYGKQHFDVSNSKVSPGAGLEERIIWELKDQQRKNSVKRTSNYILPLYRSALARMLRLKNSITVDPTTNTERDKSAARVSREILEDHWQMVNKHNPILCQSMPGMDLVQAKLYGYMLACGKGYLKPFFNPNTVSKTVLNNEMVEGAIGEVETLVLSPFDVFEDRLGQYKIEQRILPVDVIKEQYDVKLEPEDIGLSDVEQQLMGLLNGDSGKIEDAARIYEYWQIPSQEHKDGRYIISTANKLIHEGPIPAEYKRRLPYFSFDFLDLMVSLFPQGLVEQLISLQEDYNFTLSRIYAYKKYFTGKLKVPKGSELEYKYNDEVGQIIYYKAGVGEPHFEVPPSPPQYLTDELIRIRKDMEDTAGIHDSAMGRLPQDIKSGVAIENLNELDESQLRPVIMGIEQKLAFYAETVLDICGEKYVEPRILAITGDDMAVDVKTFLGSDAQGNRRIKISLGSSMPVSKDQRQQFILMLADKGYISREKALELLEFGDLDNVYRNIDESAAKTENGEMLRGVEVIPEQFEDHTRHIKVHNDYMKTDEFKKFPDTMKQLFMNHTNIHQQFLLEESKAAAAAGGQMPMPAGPQGVK